MLYEVAFECRIVRMRDRRLVQGRPQSPRRTAQLVLVVLPRYCDDVGRLLELRVQRADVLVDVTFIDDETVDLGQRRIALADATKGDDELQQIRVCLLPERL